MEDELDDPDDPDAVEPVEEPDEPDDPDPDDPDPDDPDPFFDPDESVEEPELSLADEESFDDSFEPLPDPEPPAAFALLAAAARESVL